MILVASEWMEGFTLTMPPLESFTQTSSLPTRKHSPIPAPDGIPGIVASLNAMARVVEPASSCPSEAADELNVERELVGGSGKFHHRPVFLNTWRHDVVYRHPHLVAIPAHAGDNSPSPMGRDQGSVLSWPVAILRGEIACLDHLFERDVSIALVMYEAERDERGIPRISLAIMARHWARLAIVVATKSAFDAMRAMM